MISFSNIVLAFSMSADAFAAATCKGVTLTRPKITYALRIGFVFGCVEMLAPVIGWGIGKVAGSLFTSLDHWAAFAILGLIGGKMIHAGLCGAEKECRESHSLPLLIFTAVGTSIDSMAVGVSLALIDAHILVMAAMIGAATFTMATIGIMAGHYIGTKAGRVAEVCGGLCLIAIGTSILIAHLGS